MKYYFIGLIAVMFSLPSFAGSVMESVEVDFDFFSNRSFYSCSYAERQMEGYVNAMGGEIESMRCIGGLPDSRFVNVKVDISRPTFNENSNPDDATWFSVRIRGDESCKFNKEMVEKLLTVFTTRNLEATTTCWDSRGRYDYAFEALN